MQYVYCIGSAHVDHIFTFKTAPVLGNSNHARRKAMVGGVAYNMARLLKSLGNDVAITSVVGDDFEGHGVINTIQDLGIDPATIVTIPEATTGLYSASHSADGNLYIAAADMEIYKQASIALLKPHLQKLQQAKAWIIDSTFKADVLNFLATESNNIDIYISICSISEVAHIKEPLLRKAKAIFGNVDEITLLAGIHDKSDRKIWFALENIAALGVKTVFATHGAHGVYVFHNNEKLRFDALPAEVVCVNGAGDAFAAATINGLVKGEPLDVAVKAGLKAASLQLEGKDPVVKAIASKEPVSLNHKIATTEETLVKPVATEELIASSKKRSLLAQNPTDIASNSKRLKLII